MSEARRPRLWVIDPSLDRAEEQGVHEILDGWPGDHRVFRPALRPGDGPDRRTPFDADGVVVMGSRASALDGDPWLAELSAWLSPIVAGAATLPLLGICFGHQLLAHLAGAGVGFLHDDRRKRCGVETTVLAGSRLVEGPRELRVVVSHREVVREVPNGFRVVARRAGVAVDGLEHERLPLHSFQFHPEAREEFARHAGIDEREIDARLREDSRVLLAAFRAEVLRRHEALKKHEPVDHPPARRGAGRGG